MHKETYARKIRPLRNRTETLGLILEAVVESGITQPLTYFLGPVYDKRVIYSVLNRFDINT